MAAIIRNVATYLTQILRESQFYEQGVLTPEEFVLAGDTLVATFGTWQWASSESIRKFSSYLPKDKQYLITKNVPSTFRASKFHMVSEDEVVDTETQTTWNLPSIRVFDRNFSYSTNQNEKNEIPSLQDFSHDINNTNENTKDLHQQDTRSYDISITYDKLYRTPRIYFIGYDEFGGILSFSQIAEDVSSEHLNKTVTLESHPHTGLTQLSIHPCKHAHTMKRMLELVYGQQTETLRKAGYRSTDLENRATAALHTAVPVHQYIFLFLKFINIIIPTIEYDFTTSSL